MEACFERSPSGPCAAIVDYTILILLGEGMHLIAWRCFPFRWVAMSNIIVNGRMIPSVCCIPERMILYGGAEGVLNSV